MGKDLVGETAHFVKAVSFSYVLSPLDGSIIQATLSRGMGDRSDKIKF